jgi:hypothetical protein
MYNGQGGVRSQLSSCPQREQKMTDNTYVTENGTHLELQAISLYEIDLIKDGTKEKWRKRGEPVDPPTYTIETVGGGKVTKPLTADILEVEDDEAETERRKNEWSLHENALDRMREEISKLITDLFLDGIVNITEVPQEWIDKKKKRNIAIPTDADDLLTLYKRVEIAKTYMDVIGIREKVTALSLPRIPKSSAVGAAEKSFPGGVQEEAGR